MLAQRTRRYEWLIGRMPVITRHCETEVDEFAPYERASEPGKPEVYRAFAGARYALQRICEWLIVRMPDSVKKTERFHAALRRNAGHLRGKDNMSWEEEEVRSRNRSCFTWRSFYMREQTKIIL